MLAGPVHRTFFGDLLLAEEVDADIDEAPGDVIEAWPGLGSTLRRCAPEQHDGSHEERDRRRDQEDQDDLLHGC